MQRFPAQVRKKTDDLIYDIDNVWPDGWANPGVKYTSWLIVRPESPNEGRIEVHGIKGVIEARVEWATKPWAIPITSPEPGLVSVISVDKVPLVVFWELAAGKA